MQVEEVRSEGFKREYTVTITAGELDAQRDEKLMEYAKTIRLPGFRPGKAPIAVLRQRYGKAVLGEILEKAVNDSSVKVIQEKGLIPALQPRIEVKEFDEGKDLVYSMEIEVMPDFEVAEFKGLALERPVAKISESDVDEALGRLAGQRKTSEKVEEDRASRSGDIVVIDFKGRTADDNKEHAGMQAAGHFLELGSGQFIPGFEEQLAGKKPGSKVEVKVTFPDEYQPDLAGRDAIFDVEIKEIRKVTAPAIDEQFAKDIGFADLKTLKDAARGQIEGDYQQLSRLKIKRALLDILDETNRFDVPAGLLEMEYQAIVRQVDIENRKAQGLEPEHDHVHGPDCHHDKDLSEEDRAELREIADRRVRLGLVLSKIGNQNNIAVSDQELQRAVVREAQRYPGQERAVFDYFKNNRQALDGLRAPLFEDKVVDFIIELASVTEREVDKEYLTSSDDDEELPRKSSKPATSKAKSAKTSKTAKPEDEASPGDKPAKSQKAKSSGAKKPAAKKK